MHSGSLKDVAKIYDVSYPTVRIKLDRLIEKIKLHDEVDNEDFIQFIKQLSIDDRIELEEANLIIRSEENTSKLHSPGPLECRLLLKKKYIQATLIWTIQRLPNRWGT